MKIIAGDHIEAMLLDIRELLFRPDGRTIREVIYAHTIDMPDVVERTVIIELQRDRFLAGYEQRVCVNDLPSWKPEDAK